MRWAWFCLAIYTVSSAALRFLNPSLTLAAKLALLVSTIVGPAVVLYVIRLVRHSTVRSVDELNTWGYFWRAFLLFQLQIPMLLLARLIIPFKANAEDFTAAEVLAWFAISTAMCTAGAWLLFSTDRRGQFQFMFRSLRGY
jgi:pheromone shutdown protein TraB